MTSNGAPVNGVNITIEGPKTESTTTDASGNYSFGSLPRGGNYVITPNKARVTFTPRSRSINNLTQDASADFSGLVQPEVYRISGRVTEATKPIDGVKIKLGGSRDASTTTDADGNYRFSDLPAGGNYTITPDKARMKFTPHDRSIRNLTRDESADFSRPPAAGPECSAADESREEQTIRSYLPIWRHGIEGERARIIAANAPDGAKETAAVLGEIEPQVTFAIPCKVAAVTARYKWVVSYSLNGAPRITKSVSGRRIINCGKALGMWVCH